MKDFRYIRPGDNCLLINIFEFDKIKGHAKITRKGNVNEFFTWEMTTYKLDNPIREIERQEW